MAFVERRASNGRLGKDTLSEEAKMERASTRGMRTMGRRLLREKDAAASSHAAPLDAFRLGRIIAGRERIGKK
jgi:hypothetical protein